MENIITVRNYRKKRIFIEIAAAILLLFFAHTAIDNFLNRLSLRNLLRILPITYNKADFLSWAIPIIKSITVLLLFFPRTRISGIILSIIITMIFTGYLLYTPRLPHEFGGILNYINFTQHLILISFLSILSISMFILNRNTLNNVDKKANNGTAIFT
ncbi:hypothetical protein A3860_35965 [Niastella vici]|uniref:Methylamine utilisation protein MauE domain-containing protein n=1 Tax=Niastella vici TaxID=1703345 RepID=A0A1V9FNJ2_9BACT|nr:MauE/DoxX family redox-associated membrane protein [Niastella vici]OQP59910.1 hypothetical protein A3860_35965 [Niastella vici]